jgi:hypothetical protein
LNPAPFWRIAAAIQSCARRHGADSRRRAALLAHDEALPAREISDLDRHAPLRAAAVSAARLVVHAEDEGRAQGKRFELPLRRLRALYADGPWHDEQAPLCLQIDDLQGRRVLAIDDAGPLSDVPLPAGTYQVTVSLGKVRRSYTMVLEQGASFDLYLRLAPERQ